jgi:hypothetical protein
MWLTEKIKSGRKVLGGNVTANQERGKISLDLQITLRIDAQIKKQALKITFNKRPKGGPTGS